MKKKITLLFLFTLSAAICAAQNVPNGGFESWTDGEPDDWTTTNITDFTSVFQEEPGNSGSYAIRLQSVEIDGDNVIPGIVANGGVEDRGFPISVKYTLLEFYYKTSLNYVDQVSYKVIIRDSESTLLASTSNDITEDAADFTRKELPIVYTGIGTPAYCEIEFLIEPQSISEPSLDSWFIVDDVELSSATGVQDLEKNRNSLKVFPQPASEMLNLTINSEKEINSLNLTLFDLSGKRISAYQFNDIKPGNTNKTIDVSELIDGVYVLRTVESDFVTKVLIQH